MDVLVAFPAPFAPRKHRARREKAVACYCASLWREADAISAQMKELLISYPAKQYCGDYRDHLHDIVQLLK
jgi:hypothetical protein